MQSTEATRELAQKILDQITIDPDTHDQNDYINHTNVESCGTTRCIAGWAALFAENIATEDDLWNRTDLSDKYGGSFFHVGMKTLGLNFNEAYSIFFDYDNDRATQKLKHIVVGEDWINE